MYILRCGLILERKIYGPTFLSHLVIVWGLIIRFCMCIKMNGSVMCLETSLFNRPHMDEHALGGSGCDNNPYRKIHTKITKG